MHVWASPTAWKPSTVGCPSSSTKRAQPVEQPAHRPHAADGSSGRARKNWSGPGRRRQARSKPSGSDSAVRSSPSSGRIGEGDRQRAAVAGDAEVLHEAEVAAELRVERRVEALGQPVPAGQVHEAALVDRLGHVDAELAEPGGHVAAPAGRRDDDVGLDGRAVLEPHAGDDAGPCRSSAPATSAGDDGAGAELDARLGRRRPGAAPTRGWCGAR